MGGRVYLFPAQIRAKSPKDLSFPVDIFIMKTLDTNRIGDTVRIRRPPPKVFTTELGKNVWMSGVEYCELELEHEPGTSTDPYNHGLAHASHA